MRNMRLLMTGVLATIIQPVGAAPIGECGGISGRFFVKGTQFYKEESQIERDIYFMNTASEGVVKQAGHFFEIKLEEAGAQLTATVFNYQSMPIFKKNISVNYSCVNGEWAEMGQIQGGSEGCKKDIQYKSTIRLAASGDLEFVREESYHFGVTCFKKNFASIKTVKYPIVR